MHSSDTRFHATGIKQQPSGSWIHIDVRPNIIYCQLCNMHAGTTLSMNLIKWSRIQAAYINHLLQLPPKFRSGYFGRIQICFCNAWIRNQALKNLKWDPKPYIKLVAIDKFVSCSINSRNGIRKLLIFRILKKYNQSKWSDPDPSFCKRSDAQNNLWDITGSGSIKRNNANIWPLFQRRNIS